MAVSTLEPPARRAAGREPPRAEHAGLRYVTAGEPGIARRRHGRGFRYLNPDGTTVRDKETRARIRSLAVPPAWKDVWICPDADGHIQATGRDARGRKQYRYHSRWREVRDAAKYVRMVQFGDALPRIREAVERDLARPGLPRDKVVATLVRLLETTLFRIGNPEYARDNGSHGLTTLRDEHVDVHGHTMRFHFRGKGGKAREVDLADRRLSRIVKRCQDLPGQELFQYLDGDGAQGTISSTDVNAYLRAAGGAEFTAKDFRTWAGTLRTFQALRAQEPPHSATAARRATAAVIRQVAQQLGNTPAVCRKCYVHPAVVEAFQVGELPAFRSGGHRRGLDADEAALMRLLRRRQATSARPRAAAHPRRVQA